MRKELGKAAPALVDCGACAALPPHPSIPPPTNYPLFGKRAGSFHVRTSSSLFAHSQSSQSQRLPASPPDCDAQEEYEDTASRHELGRGGRGGLSAVVAGVRVRFAGSASVAVDRLIPIYRLAGSIACLRLQCSSASSDWEPAKRWDWEVSIAAAATATLLPTARRVAAV